MKAKLDKAKIASEKPLVVANGNEIKQIVSDQGQSGVIIHLLQSKGTSKGREWSFGSVQKMSVKVTNILCLDCTK